MHGYRYWCHIHYKSYVMYMAFFMSKKILTFVGALCLFFILMCGSNISVLAQPEQQEPTLKENQLYARACALLDGDSGRVLYGKEENAPMANASTTKILTCIVTLECGEKNLIATASKLAAKQPKVHLGMYEGQQFYVKDLLYGLMLASYNDCAVAIAEAVAGSVEAFAALMNEKAKELGCEDSYFITPNGLDAQDENGFHHSTAQDLCRIMKYCVWESEKSEQFLAVTQTKNYAFSSLSGENYSVTNMNAFLTMMDGVLSGKTGFTADAGYCYVAALESEGRKFCIALLACGWPNNKNYKWSDAKTLFSFGINQFEYEEVPKHVDLPEIKVEHARVEEDGLQGWQAQIYLSPRIEEEEVLSQYLIQKGQSITYRYSVNMDVCAPVQSTDVVGHVIYYVGEEPVFDVPVYAGKDYGRWSFKALLVCLIHEFFYI